MNTVRFANSNQIAFSDELLAYDIRSLELVSIDGALRLYAATGRNGGITSLEINTDGSTAEVLDTLTFTDFESTQSPGTIRYVTDGSSSYLAIGVGANGALNMTELAADGSLLDDEITQSDDLPTAFAGGFTIYDHASGPTSVWIDESTGRLSAAAIEGRDGIQQFELRGESSAFSVSEASTIAVGRINDAQFAFLADPEAHRLSVYGLDAEARELTLVDDGSAFATIGIGTPSAISFVAAHGGHFLFVGGFASSSVSVFHVSPAGALTLTDHLIDTGTTRFGGIGAIETVTAGEFTFVVMGGADDGLSLFTLLPDGSLVHLQSIAHTVGDNLQNISTIRAAVTGDEIQIFIASSAQPGLTQINIPIADLSQIRGSAGSDSLVGTSGADILIAEGAITTDLRGGDGEDILIAGMGTTLMSGGSGRDTFVVSEIGSSVTIRDFTLGEDNLDLSRLEGLRGPSQITLEGTSTGAILHIGETRVTLETSDRQTPTLLDLFGHAFDWPDRIVTATTALGDIFQTAPEGGFVRGSSAADIVYGESGPDNVWSQGGDDTLYGGIGADTLGGGDGRDELHGNEGNDVLFGGAGADTLYGGIGHDQVWGGTGDDILRGYTGDDSLGGYIGDDTIWGGAGDDLIFGDIGDDLIFGDLGDDTLWAGPDDDVSEGGFGNDVMGGGTGRDTLDGGAGNDMIYGGQQSDELFGGSGRDTLYAGNGNDTLHGGSGDDVLSGGFGDDILTGGGGADFFGFGVDQGADVITDFGGDDQLQLFLPGNVQFDDLQIEANTAGDAVIRLGSGSITLEDVNPGDLTPDDFIFV